MDNDRNRSLSLDEFKKGVSDYGLKVEDDVLKKLFEQLDTDGSGSLDFEEFLQALRVGGLCFHLYFISVILHNRSSSTGFVRVHFNVLVFS